MNIVLEFPDGTSFYRVRGELLAQIGHTSWLRLDKGGFLSPVAAPLFGPLPRWDVVSEAAFRSELAAEAALPEG